MSLFRVPASLIVLILLVGFAPAHFTAAQSTTDHAVLPHRGFMIDMVRMKERDDYYLALVDQLALFGYNALYLHFTDDEGLTIELRSHPELVSDYAMDQTTLRRLIAKADSLGIEVVPEIEAWGHAGWITDHYPHLADTTDTGTLAMGNEAVYDLLDDIIGEVAALFDNTPFVHIGMDEAWYPMVPDVTPELDRHIAAHVNRVVEMVTSRGRTPMMWADMVTGRPRVLEQLPEEVVMVDWRYWIHETEEEAAVLSDAGFPVITGPAIMWYETRVHPGPHNWENVRRLVGVARDLRLQGSVVTAWLPQRYVPGVLPHAIAYAGLLMQDPEMADPEVSMASFVHTYFGTDDPEVARAFVRLAGIESTRSDLFATFWSDEASFSERLTPENRAQDSAYLHRVAGLGHAFKRLEERIARNHQDFQAYVLLADLLEYLGSRRTLPAAVDYALAQAQAERERGNEGMAADRLATMTAHLHALRAARLHLIDRMNEHWDHYRYPDHPLKSGGGPNSLMWWLKDDRHHAFAEQELVERLESDS